MPRVRYIGSARRYKTTDGSVNVTRDDPEIDVDEETAQYLLEETDQFEAVDETDDDTVAQEDEPPDNVEPPLDPGDFTVSELEAELDDSDFSDAELEAIGTAEANGQNRTGVRGAIDTRLED